MTRDRTSRPYTARDPSPRRWPLRPLLAAALVVCAVLTVAAVVTGTVGVVAAQDDATEPTVAVTDATADPGDNVTVEVVLTAAPDGLAGYETRLSLADGDARVVSVDYPDQFDLTTDPDIGPDGQTVRLEAADLGDRIGPGTEDVTLATVTVAAGSEETAVTVADLQVDADGGARVSPATDPGRLSVDGEPQRTDPSSVTPAIEETESGSEMTTATARGQGSPGFGVPAAVAALVLVLVGLLARRR